MWKRNNQPYESKGDSEDEGCWKLHLISSGSWKFINVKIWNVWSTIVFVLVTQWWMWGQFLICSFKTESCQSWPWLGLSKNWPHIHYWEKSCKHFKSSKQIQRELRIQIFPHQDYEPQEIKRKFQQP